MRIKSLRAAVKALDSEGQTGSFEALVSTYDVDSVGDKVAPGAFGKSLQEWTDSGDPIPVVWSHQHADAFAHIGVVEQAEERGDEGLWIKAALDLENPTAAQVYRLLKGNRIRQFSFAYDVRGSDGPDAAGITTLTDIKLYEVGPTLIGANQETRLLDVKHGVKAGRVLSAKNESDLRSAVELISGVLAQLADGASSDDPQAAKASDESPAKLDEPRAVKSDEPSSPSSVDALAAVISLRTKEAI